MMSVQKVTAAVVLFTLSGAALGTPAVVTPIVTQALPYNSASTTSVALGTAFSDPGTSVWRWRYALGNPTTTGLDFGTVDMALFETRAPLTAANFKKYMTRALGTNNTIQGTWVHRAANLNASLAYPIQIVQGGAYYYNSSGQLGTVVTDPPVNLEYTLPNKRGTIAMARTNVQNSATSQYFWNLTDNSTTLGQGNGGGYAVFGKVLDGMPVLDNFNNMQIVNFGQGFESVATTPDYDYNSPGLPKITQVVSLYTIVQLSDVNPLTFSVGVSDASILDASVTGSTLSLKPKAGKFGNVTVTITATSPDETTLQSSFVAKILSPCGPADIVSNAGDVGADGILAATDVVKFFEGFFGSNLLLADIANNSGDPVPDGLLTGSDVVKFFDSFFKPCAG